MLERVARLVEVVAGDGDDRGDFLAAASDLRWVADEWARQVVPQFHEREIASALARDRWRDVGELAAICTRVARAAGRRQRRNVGERLRDVACFLADFDFDRGELLLVGLNLAWCAGEMSSYEPRDCCQEVLEEVVRGIGMAATVADHDHPRLYNAWIEDPTKGLD